MQSIISLVFFITYTLCQPPATILCRKIGPRVFLGTITFLWGVVMIGFGLVNNWQTLIGLRLILGIFEAGFFPGKSLKTPESPRLQLQLGSLLTLHRCGVPTFYLVQTLRGWQTLRHFLHDWLPGFCLWRYSRIWLNANGGRCQLWWLALDLHHRGPCKFLHSSVFEETEGSRC